MVQIKKRIIYYDFLKFIASIMVVFYHLGTINYGSINGNVYFPNMNRIIMNLCQVSVPIFFMVNGAILLNRQINKKNILKKSIKAMLIYIIWSKAIGVILSFINSNYTSININSNCSLWFLRTLSWLYLLYPLIKLIYDKNNKYLIYLLSILFIFPFMYNYIILIFKIFNVELYNLNKLPRTGAFTLYSILYFILGGLLVNSNSYIRKIIDKKKELSIIFLIIGLCLSTLEGIILTNINGVIFDGVNSSFPTIGALFMSIGVFYISLNYIKGSDKYMNKIYEFIGKNSIGVYIFHMPLICLFKNTLGVEYQSLYLSLITSIGITILSSIINYILIRIPIIKWTLKI